jgi:hypothetical protein
MIMEILLIVVVSIGGACFLFCIGSRLEKKGQSINVQCDRAESILNAFKTDIAESPACCASIVSLLGKDARCECFRCRTERGESVTEESQGRAEVIQEMAAKRFSEIVDSIH